MTGKIITKAEVERLNLNPKGYAYTSGKSIFRFYGSPSLMTILEEREDGTFKVRAWVRP